MAREPIRIVRPVRRLVDPQRPLGQWHRRLVITEKVSDSRQGVQVRRDGGTIRQQTGLVQAQSTLRHRTRSLRRAAVPVDLRQRVIEYTLDGGNGTVYRLITTVCDPDQAPAAELAPLYHQRWEIENALDEIKTHQGGRHLVLHAQHPDGVEQEIYGFLLVHHALRDVIHDTAHQASLEPDRIFFTRTLNAACRHVTDQAALSPYG